MGAPPYALSISHFVSTVGADAGFAAIIGLAILVLLYFAQARETASLRDRFAEAAEQVRQLELRVAHLSRPAAAAQPSVAPRPAVAAGSPVPSRTVRPRPLADVPMAPAGVGAPNLSAATRVVPGGDDRAIAIAPGTRRVAVGAGAGAVAVAEADHEGEGPEASGGGGVIAPPGPAPATAAGAGAATGAGGAGTQTNGGGRTPTPAPAAGAGALPGRGNGGSGTAVPPRPGQGAERPYRIAGARPGGQSAPPRRPVGPPAQAQRSRLPGALIIILGLILVGAIVALLLVLTSSSGTSTSASSHTSSAITKAPSHRRKTPVTALKPSQVTVAVLNGTATSNLAHDVSLKLTNAGYNPGTIATATDQTQTATTVGYLPGSRRAALIVARSLNLGATAIQPVTQSNRAVACPQAACTAQVVVTVGSDLASAATTSAAPSPAASSTTP